LQINERDSKREIPVGELKENAQRYTSQIQLRKIQKEIAGTVIDAIEEPRHGIRSLHTLQVCLVNLKA
jgi:hypothetical protein